MRRLIKYLFVFILLLSFVNTTHALGGEDKEKKDKRGIYSKVFENNNGKETIYMYANPIHYYDEKGTLLEIDNSLIKGTDNNGEFFTNKKSNVSYKFSRNSNSMKLVTVSYEKYSLSWNIENANKVYGSVRKLEQNNEHFVLDELESKIVYDKIFDNATLEFHLNSVNMKENIIFDSKPKTEEIRYSLNIKSLIPTVEGGKVVFKDDEDGSKIFVFEAPFFEDSSDSRLVFNDINVRIVNKGKKKYELIYSFDPNMFDKEKVVYPLIFDPIITLDDSSLINDSYIREKYPTSSYYSSTKMIVGSYGYLNRLRSFIEFRGLENIQLNPANTYKAFMNLKLWYGTSSWEGLDIVPVKWNYLLDVADITWSNQHYLDYESYISSESYPYTDGSYKVFKVDISKHFNKEKSLNRDTMMFKIQYTDESISDYNYIYSTNYGSKYPVVEIVDFGVNGNYYESKYGYPYVLDDINNVISSGFGYRTVFGEYKKHKGIDLVGPPNDNIGQDSTYAFCDGIVYKNKYSSAAGNYVSLKCAEKDLDTDAHIFANYFHLYEKPDSISGNPISRGDVVGKVGTTGISSGNHLHFEVNVSHGNGTWLHCVNEDQICVNPIYYWFDRFDFVGNMKYGLH